MYSKKAETPIIKIISVIVITSIFLISWVLILNINISVDERKINTQLGIKTVLDSNCFSDEYASIEKEKFNSDTFKSCFGKSNQTTLRLKLGNQETFSNKDLFENLAGKCSTKSSLLCTELKYPIIYKTENKNQIKELTIQIISQ